MVGSPIGATGDAQREKDRVVFRKNGATAEKLRRYSDLGDDAANVHGQGPATVRGACGRVGDARRAIPGPVGVVGGGGMG